jgi:hypothetical protein
MLWGSVCVRRKPDRSATYFQYYPLRTRPQGNIRVISNLNGYGALKVHVAVKRDSTGLGMHITECLCSSAQYLFGKRWSCYIRVAAQGKNSLEPVVALTSALVFRMHITAKRGREYGSCQHKCASTDFGIYVIFSPTLISTGTSYQLHTGHG